MLAARGLAAAALRPPGALCRVGVARQFLGLMEKPDVDYIEGLSPAISIDQKGVSKNPRSTVATVTEVYDYLRLLYARAGTPHCPNCDRVIERQTVQQIVDAIRSLAVRA